MSVVGGQSLGKAYAVCRTHFYKVLVLSVIGLMVLQYALSSTFSGGKSYFLSGYSLSLYSSDKGDQALGGSNVTLFNSSIALPPPSYMPSVFKNETKLNSTTLNHSNAFNSNTTEAINGTVTNSSLLHNKTLPQCPPVPPKLVGPLKVWSTAPTMEELEAKHPELSPGGRFKPPDCISKYKVAIIIPYRDREYHLRLFLDHMHPILQRQQLDYGIFIIEEAGKTKFNRATLMNIGFVEALKLYDWQCFVFHDVDLLPENDLNIYSCPTQPRHMSVAVDTMSYKLPYADIFGGVSALTKEQMTTVNGFSNEFWGWGGEDDDMSNRVRYYGYKISRYPNNIARYKMMKHSKDTPNPDRYNKLYKGKSRFKSDGLNSLKYDLKDVQLKRLYTWVYVDLHPPK